MNPLDAPRGPFDLQWRLLGIRFRVQPSFWIINLLFGYFYVRHFRLADERLLAYLGLWLLCAFVSVLIHELGHVTTGRIFGASSDILLHQMGGLAIGNFGKLPRWQRILVNLGGVTFGFALFAFAEYGLPRVIRAYDSDILATRWYKVIAAPFGLFQEGEFPLPGMLVIMSLIWNLYNLVPILPLDGGMVMLELVTMVFTRQGIKLAYGFSFLLAGSLTAYSIIAWMRPGVYYPMLDPLFAAIMFGMMAWGSLTTLRSLTPSEPTEARPRRYREYEEKDW